MRRIRQQNLRHPSRFKNLEVDVLTNDFDILNIPMTSAAQMSSSACSQEQNPEFKDIYL